MKGRESIVRDLTQVIAIFLVLCVHLFGETGSLSRSSPSPQMERLIEVFVGTWDTSETMARSEFFPHGGARHGVANFRPTADGAALVEEGHSDGSAGRLSFYIVIWWDEDATLYRFLTCFHAHRLGCELRGTAHWDGDIFVNDYEEVIKAKKTRFTDSFSHMSAAYFTLVEAISAENGSKTPLVTTHYNRQ